jgi:hypothetical protein
MKETRKKGKERRREERREEKAKLSKVEKDFLNL